MPTAVVHWTWLDELAEGGELGDPDAGSRALRDLLPPDEVARATRMSEPVARRWTAGRVWVRRVLGARLGCEPRDVPLAAEPTGRPILATAGAPTISITHSDLVVAVGLATGATIGIDVEGRIPLGEDAIALAATVGGPAEVEAFRAVPASELAAAFQRWWVAKESVLKAIGTGFLGEAHRTEVDVARRRLPAPWRLTELGDLGRGQWLAAALDSDGDVEWIGPGRGGNG